MKRPILLLALTALLAVLLSACGALIPPQSFQNPVGLQGQKVTATVTGSSPRMAPQALTTLAVGNGTVSATFDDIDLSDVPVGIAKYQVALGFDATASVSVPNGGTLPSTITLTNTSLDVIVSDSTGSVALPTMSYLGTLTLTQNSGSDYTVSGSVNQGEVGQIFTAAVTSGTLADLLKIIAQQGDTKTPNTATATLSFTTDDLPDGSTVDFTFSAGTGTVSF